MSTVRSTPNFESASFLSRHVEEILQFYESGVYDLNGVPNFITISWTMALSMTVILAISSAQHVSLSLM